MTKTEALERTIATSRRLIARAAANKEHADDAVRLAKELTRTAAKLQARLLGAREKARTASAKYKD